MNRPDKPLGHVVLTGGHLTNRGGVAAYLRALIPALQHRRYLVSFVPIGSNQSRPSSAYRRVYEVREATRLITQKLLSGGGFSVLHANPSMDLRSLVRVVYLLRVVSRQAPGTRRVVQFHGWRDRALSRLSPRFLLLRQVLRQCHVALFLAPLLRDRVAARFHPPSQLLVIPIGTDLTRIAAIARQRTTIATALFLSRIERAKGILDLLRALRLLHDKGFPLRLLIAGSGHAEVHAHRLATELGLRETVEFLGYVRGDDKLAAYDRADLFVLPSFREGFPVSIVEAMAAGLPIVTTPVGAVPQILGSAGVLVSPGAPSALADTILQLARDPARIASCSAGGIRQAPAYGIDRVADRLVDVYASGVLPRPAGSTSWLASEER